jgi:hypothetical protein
MKGKEIISDKKREKFREKHKEGLTKQIKQYKEKQ